MAERYDLIVVGGGIAGSSLAGRVAASGASVLLLEREREFRDRVRGEWVAPWGVLELEQLGILEVLRERASAHDVRYQNSGVYGLAPKPRDLLERSKPRRCALTFFHPNAQEALLGWAAELGAEVIRGARVTSVVGGEAPAVTWDGDGEHAASARLVVGADGRTSMVRKQIERPEQTRGEMRLWAGVRIRNLNWPSDTGMLTMDPASGYAAAVFPQGDGTARVYLGPARDERKRLSGAKDVDSFLAGLKPLLGDLDVFGAAEAVGPLATFDTEMRWIDNPCEDGLALIGDAAGYTDPTWGQGLSLGFRDARVLSEALTSNDDWRAAASQYGSEHDRYFNAMVQGESWQEELLLGPGPEGDAKRALAFAAWGTDHTRNPDAAYNGPDFPADEQARQRYFGLDLM
ncbi:MAG: NAD(P)/FAD-dependent oxidoreductase [Chloroflexi bacterium]|nr:NAD(P)/FAD-dependent oxidoreductase [Chloroflexota bacterium]MDA1145336.1 NAD(P)/FAD-dependent oxidoreductase [Chloroflexota bacterium]